jgi:predicted N-formylglutamate amidohydrolase
MLALDHPGLDWPQPLEVLNPRSDAEIVLICDHASNHIPAEYRGLGVGAADLRRHIAWDVGAAGVTRGLAAALGAPAFLGGYSRLLIDLNRPLGSTTSMPVISEATPIPGNRDLPLAEIERRRRLIFEPFHDGIASFLDARESAGKPSRIVAIHSFTPVFLGMSRPWHAGILHEGAPDYAAHVMSGLARDPALVVGENVPYQIERTSDYAIPVHGTDRGSPALLIEIRNDLISDAAGIREWTDRLAAVL